MKIRIIFFILCTIFVYGCSSEVEKEQQKEAKNAEEYNSKVLRRWGEE